MSGKLPPKTATTSPLVFSGVGTLKTPIQPDADIIENREENIRLSLNPSTLTSQGVRVYIDEAGAVLSFTGFKLNPAVNSRRIGGISIASNNAGKFTFSNAVAFQISGFVGIALPIPTFDLLPNGASQRFISRRKSDGTFFSEEYSAVANDNDPPTVAVNITTVYNCGEKKNSCP